MDGLKKSLSSNLDALIEKFRTETNRESQENFVNTRRLTTESPYKPSDMEPSHDIDRQITDLESLIKRLQDEIIDMSKEADKPLNEDNLREWFTEAHYNLDVNEDDQSNKNNIDSDNMDKINQDSTNQNTDHTNSHVFPVILTNINPLNIDQHNNVTDDYVSHIHSASTLVLAANFKEIRKNFSLLWDDVEDEIISKKSEDLKARDTSVTFIALRPEIRENIMNNATEMLLCNSKEDLTGEYDKIECKTFSDVYDK